jgi:hypothetical protein
MPDVVRVNDATFAWQSTRTKFDGELFESVTAFSYDNKLETSVIHGQLRSGAPIARTSGKWTPPEVKVTMLAESADALCATMAIKSGQGSYGAYRFNTVFQAFEIGLPPMNLFIGRCRIIGVSKSFQEGPDGLKKDITLAPMSIVENGFTIYRKI